MPAGVLPSTAKAVHSGSVKLSPTVKQLLRSRNPDPHDGPPAFALTQVLTTTLYDAKERIQAAVTATESPRSPDPEGILQTCLTVMVRPVHVFSKGKFEADWTGGWFSLPPDRHAADEERPGHYGPIVPLRHHRSSGSRSPRITRTSLSETPRRADSGHERSRPEMHGLGRDPEGTSIDQVTTRLLDVLAQ